MLQEANSPAAVQLSVPLVVMQLSRLLQEADSPAAVQLSRLLQLAGHQTVALVVMDVALRVPFL